MIASLTASYWSEMEAFRFPEQILCKESNALDLALTTIEAADVKLMVGFDRG